MGDPRNATGPKRRHGRHDTAQAWQCNAASWGKRPSALVAKPTTAISTASTSSCAAALGALGGEAGGCGWLTSPLGDDEGRWALALRCADPLDMGLKLNGETGRNRPTL